MHFDNLGIDRSDAVTQTYAGVGEAAGVENDRIIGLEFLQIVDYLSLMIALKKTDLCTVAERDFFEFCADIFESAGSVNLWFAFAEQIEIRAVDYVNHLN